MSTPDPDATCVNTVRFPSVDMVQHASSGHPGVPMGAAPMAYVLVAAALLAGAGTYTPGSIVLYVARQEIAGARGDGVALVPPDASGGAAAASNAPSPRNELRIELVRPDRESEVERFDPC